MIDDALSALDAYVGKKIMDKVFSGAMSKKTRVMVTHHIGLLEGNVDKVILLSNGNIIQSGRFEEVKKTKEYQEFANADTVAEEPSKQQNFNEEELEHALQKNKLPENSPIENFLTKN